MREILYRIWDEKIKMYVQDTDDFFIDPDGELYTIDLYEGINRFCKPDRYNIEQYTGLKDKNGKKIFEGDVTIHREHETKGEWKLSEKYASFLMIEQNGEHRFYFDIDSESLEIIGNIHEEVQE